MIFKRTRKEIPIKVVGVYHYPADDKLLNDTLILQYGEDLSEEEMEQAKLQVAEHFENLFLIEILSTTPLQESHWSDITQKQAGLPRENWQVPYDERKLDEQGCHWAFFLHYLNPKKPLMTPFGEVPLPNPSEWPPHLKAITYEAPG